MSGQRRTIEDRAADRQVARALRGAGGTATLADVVVATALPERVAERSLDRLLEEYDSSVGVAKGGALLYRFRVGPLGLRRRRERRRLLRAIIVASASAAAWLATTVRFLFRALLALQLMVYLFVILAPVTVVVGTVLGIVLLVVGIVGAISGGGDISGLIELLFEPYALLVIVIGCALFGIFLVAKWKYAVILALVGKDDRGRTGLAGFIGQVNDFALGPERPRSRRDRIDRSWTVSQADARIVLERVRRHGGRLRAGQLVRWLGLDLAGADGQATRIAVEYGGEPSATDLEVVEFTLPLLLTTAGEPADPSIDEAAEKARADKVQTRYERGPALPRLTGNSLGEDLVIALFSLFVAGAGWVASHFIAPLAVPGHAHAGWWRFGAWAGLVGLAFSALLFALFFLRIPLYALHRNGTTRRLRRARIHDAIVGHARSRPNRALDLEELATETVATPSEVRAIALGLGGQFDLDAADDPKKTVWRFRRLGRELANTGLPTAELVTAEELSDSAALLSSHDASVP